WRTPQSWWIPANACADSEISRYLPFRGFVRHSATPIAKRLLSAATQFAAWCRLNENDVASFVPP
ncbi:hypothetical protein, partial [Brevundimonas vesicularis]|uniref:hypothetical protein n=1 Tax=Brevundimonas vesicularis TaxID=41276 RepID=UPI001C3FAFCB